MKWLFETDIFDENLEEFYKEVGRQGGSYKLVKYKPFENVENYLFENYDPDDGTVIFYGSLNLAAKIQKHTKWKVYCTLENYECSKYYPVFSKFLLNHDYIIIPFKNLSDKIFDYFNANVCFARPSHGGKCFDGQLLGKISLKNQLYSMSQDTSKNELVFLSSLKRVEKEWRLVVTDKVITGSQYKDNGLIEFGNVPDHVIYYATNVLNSVNYRPDPIWTLDICEFEGKLYVLEIGGFSCAGLYDCDISKIVAEVHRLHNE